MKIGSKWDRISKCYVTNYEEIIEKGLPFFELMKKRQSNNTAIFYFIYFFYRLINDSHIFRKYGSRKSIMVMKKAKNLLKKISFQKKITKSIVKF